MASVHSNYRKTMSKRKKSTEYKLERHSKNEKPPPMVCRRSA